MSQESDDRANTLDFTRRLSPVQPRVGKKTWIGLGVAILALIAMVALIYGSIALSWHSEDERLKKEGINTSAIVLDHRTMTASRSVNYLVDLGFPIPAWGESAHRAAVYTPYELWMQLRVGEVVPVIYAKSNPDLTRINFNDVYHKGHPHAAAVAGLLRSMLGVMAVFVAAMGFAALKTFVLDDEPVRRGKKFGAVD